MKLGLRVKKISVSINKADLKQSGQNRQQNFKYFKLKDFLPTLNELMLENEVSDRITVEYNKEAEQYEQVLYLYYGDESLRYAVKLQDYETPVSKNGNKVMQDVQYTGAINTYLSRYLYTNAFSISDGDVIDDLDNNDRPQPHQPSIQKDYNNEEEMFQIGVSKTKDAILKKLDNEEYRPYKLQVLAKLCTMYKVESFDQIKIKDKIELDALGNNVKTKLEIVKAELKGDI